MLIKNSIDNMVHILNKGNIYAKFDENPKYSSSSDSDQYLFIVTLTFEINIKQSLGFSNLNAMFDQNTLNSFVPIVLTK